MEDGEGDVDKGEVRDSKEGVEEGGGVSRDAGKGEEDDNVGDVNGDAEPEDDAVFCGKSKNEGDGDGKEDDWRDRLSSNQGL